MWKRKPPKNLQWQWISVAKLQLTNDNISRFLLYYGIIKPIWKTETKAKKENKLDNVTEMQQFP